MPQPINISRGARSLLHREVDAHPSIFSRVRPLHIRSAPLLLLAASFAIGVLCRPNWQPPLPMASTCTLLLIVAGVARWKAPRLTWGACAIAWVSLGWMAAVLEPRSDLRSLEPYTDNLQRTAEVQVLAVRNLPTAQELAAVDDPDATEAPYETREPTRQALQSLEVQVQRIEHITPDISEMLPATGGVRVTTTALKGTPPLNIPCGAHLSLTLRLREPQRYLDPGVWQYAESLASRGIAATSNADIAKVRILDTAHVPLSCRFANAQSWSAQRMQQLIASPQLNKLPKSARLTPQDAAMLNAMLFGDRALLSHSLRNAFERTGTFHLFVVAGMHVALILAAIFWLLRKLHLPAWLASLAALAATTGYAILTGFGAPVQRSLFMCAVYLFARILGRDRNPLNALGAAALAMLVLHPSTLYEAGFQMTVLSVIAIAGIAVPLCERTLSPYIYALQDVAQLRHDPAFRPQLAQFRVSMRWFIASFFPPTKQKRSRRPSRQRNIPLQVAAFIARQLLRFVELVIITVVAEIVLALPMAFYFHRVTPFAAPVNLVALPLIGVIMFSAVATFLSSLLSVSVALIPSACTALLLHTLAAAVHLVGSLRSADLRMPSPWIVCSLSAFLLWTIALSLLRDPSRRRGLFACALLPVTIALILWPRRPAVAHNAIDFTAIDVGQGDSLFLAGPDGKTMLIDAGGPTGSAAASEQSRFDIGEEVVSPYLWSRNTRRVDVVVLTHAHSDHIGGMLAVLRNFRPHELWLSVDATTPSFQALMREAAEQHITVRHLRAGNSIDWSGLHLQALSPVAAYQSGTAPGNDDSLVLRLNYGKASVLAEGDAERNSEAYIATELSTPVTLLKVGHHGSNTSTTDSLIHAAKPRFAIISCGQGNRFGHPRPAVLQRLQDTGASVARTDEMGAVRYVLHSDGTVETHVLLQEQ